MYEFYILHVYFKVNIQEQIKIKWLKYEEFHVY